ncbi:MAG: hypothetical protein U0T32_04740 [Chitinophagales bacterium]
MKMINIMVYVFALLSVSFEGCMQEKTFVHDEIMCANKDWYCNMDCTVGETPESILRYRKNCITAYFKNKHIVINSVDFVFVEQPNTTYSCGNKSGWQIIVNAPEMYSNSLKKLGFQ